jgi:hypothetical protein
MDVVQYDINAELLLEFPTALGVFCCAFCSADRGPTPRCKTPLNLRGAARKLFANSRPKRARTGAKLAEFTSAHCGPRAVSVGIVCFVKKHALGMARGSTLAQVMAQNQPNSWGLKQEGTLADMLTEIKIRSVAVLGIGRL